MKTDLMSLLACASCGNPFTLHVQTVVGSEIMEGEISCPICAVAFPIRNGIPRFLSHNGLTEEKRATADAFGYEWTHYSSLTEADRAEFLDWIAPLTPANFRDLTVLDAGCGKGRHISLVSQFGAKTVVGIDLSDAVGAAYQNTRHLSNVHVVQADISNLPFTKPFDLIYSIGVLHHLPVPKDGFTSLAKHLKPGGRFSIWVYGKEGNAWIEHFVDPVRKNVTSRLPRRVTQCLSFFPAVILYAALKALYLPARRRPWLKRLLPYSDYLCFISIYSFAETFWNVFDQLVAPTAFYHTEEEVTDWFATAELSEVLVTRRNNNSWRGTAISTGAQTRPVGSGT